MTVSIVAYHTPEDELRACLASLTSSVVDVIYIVDNGREERLRHLAAEYEKVEYIPAPNKGYGAGHNIAIRRALDDDSDFHLVLNSDVYFVPSLLDSLIDEMRKDPEIGLIHPRLIYPDGSLQPTARLLPTPLDVFGRRFLPECIFSRRNQIYTLQGLDLSVAHDVAYVQGSFMLMRTEALRRVGLFDERFFMYPEDIDLTRRLHRHFRTLYWPMLKAVHAHRAASYHNLKMLRIHIVNMIRYFNKWGWWRDPERRRINKEVRKLLPGSDKCHYPTIE